MKRLFLTSLPIVAILLAVSTSAQVPCRTKAIVQRTTKISNNITTRRYITPFNLVENAYQGGYQAHSIPGFASLIDGARMGRITAKDLVKAAIESENLLPETIDDRDYLRRVEVQLRSIGH
jgi:hypothetical protein